MLSPEPHSPHVCSGEVIGTDGGKAWVMHHAGQPTADLWALDADRCNMARVPMDSAMWRALSVLAAEVAARLDSSAHG